MQAASHIAPHTGYLPRLTELRLVVICLIVIGHISTLPLGPDKLEFLHFLGYNPSWIGIQLLFMISGFLAMRSLMRHGSPLKLIRSRVFNIVPVLAVYTAIAVFILFPWLGEIPAGESFIAKMGEYAARVLTCVDPSAKLSGIFEDALYICDIQGALWTLRWGLIAYVATAILWMTGLLRQTQSTLTLAIMMTAGYGICASIGFFDFSARGEVILTGGRLGYAFVMGLAAYRCLPLIRFRWSYALGFAALIAVMQLFENSAAQEIIIELGLGYLLLCIIGRKAQPKPTARIPDIAAGLYIFHWPIAQTVLFLRPGSTPLELLALSAVPIVGLALSVWYLVQRPITGKILTAPGALPKPS